MDGLNEHFRCVIVEWDASFKCSASKRLVRCCLFLLLSKVLRNESGVTSIEYALIGILVALAVIVGATIIGSKLNSGLESIGSYLI